MESEILETLNKDTKSAKYNSLFNGRGIVSLVPVCDHPKSDGFF